eukprot:4145433-Alexandrium_andersonii.AAC.1
MCIRDSSSEVLDAVLGPARRKPPAPVSSPIREREHVVALAAQEHYVGVRRAWAQGNHDLLLGERVLGDGHSPNNPTESTTRPSSQRPWR